MFFRCSQCKTAIELNPEETALTHCPSCAARIAFDEVGAGWQEEREIEHFRLLERVGEGTFGTVWRARDTQLERTVAVKLPRLEQMDTEQLLREARSAAQVHHPNIVEVFELGTHEGRPYIATEFIEGTTLDRWLRDNKPTPRQAAEMVATLADALHEAHTHGVIHRDLKPGNVMIDDSGMLHVTDFGLAKRDSAEGSVALDGEIIGTPAYMSPEQARGQGHHATPEMDIYGLGGILYCLLTGTAPFDVSARFLLNTVLTEVPRGPRTFDAKIPRDIETICLKALEKEPAKRYQSAAEMAADLRRFIEDRPIKARPVSVFERSWRWARRNKIPVTLVTLVLMLAGVLGVIWTAPPEGARRVHISTDPPATRLQFIPIDPATRRRERGSDVVEASATPADVWLLPGEYLVVAESADGRFHEVFRRVPTLDEYPTSPHPHANWKEQDDGVIVLPDVRLFADREVPIELLPVDGGRCTIGGEGVHNAEPHENEVSRFFLGRTEVSYGEYCQALRGQQFNREELALEDPLYPVVNLRYSEVLYFLEKVGCRLPTEIEYEFAATAGGEQRYPNDAAVPDLDNDWRPRPVRTVTSDVGPYGHLNLYSNVAEVTDSTSVTYRHLYPSRFEDSDSKVATVFGQIAASGRVVRGGLASIVVPGFGGETTNDPRDRFGVRLQRLHSEENVGFRAARSARPRFE